MKPKVTLFIVACIGALFGLAISLGISNSEAQPAGAKHFQFVHTGKQVHDPKDKLSVKVDRFEDLEYGIVCYMGGQMGMPFGCAKK